MSWCAPLPAWYAAHGRHQLPWRRSCDPWAVLVSEMMLQQTSVARVLPRWERFLGRWPTPRDCAAAPLEEVLREWQGLGYPRRALALWRTAATLAARGWPGDEAGLRELPGVGAYTARALLCFAFPGADAAPPRDVNLARVAARAGFGREPHEVAPRRLDAALRDARPPGMDARHHAYALFDLGAAVCTARAPRCHACPLHRCAARPWLRGRHPATPPRRQAAYQGSLRQLRGAVLRELLGASPPRHLEELRGRLAAVPAAVRPGTVEAALASLRADGLVAGGL